MLASVISLFSLGTGEIVVILVIVLLLFGAKKIPDLARGMGKGIREFKDASREIQREIESESAPRSETTSSSKTTES